MNIKALSVTAATIAMMGTVAFTPSAEAYPSRTYCGSTDDGTEYCVSPVGRNSVKAIFNNKYDLTGFNAHMNCSTGYLQWIQNNGYSEEGMTNIMKYACNN